MNPFQQFIANNRQLGSTTRLVELTIGKDGYLVVGSEDMKRAIVHNHPRLNPSNVLTLHDIREGKWPTESRPVFVDTTALWYAE